MSNKFRTDYDGCKFLSHKFEAQALRCYCGKVWREEPDCALSPDVTHKRDIRQELYNAGETDEFVGGYFAGMRAERERCAKIAETWGYSYSLHPAQPFAEEFNHKLRVQNKAIADKIREGI